MEEDVKQAFEKIDQNFARIDEQFLDVRKAFELTWSMMEHNSEEIRSELRAEFRSELHSEIGALRAEMRTGFARVDTEFADVRADIALVAEGVIKVNEKVDLLADLPARVAALEARNRR